MTLDANASPPPQVKKKLHKILVEAVNAMPEAHALELATQMAEPVGARLVGFFVENQALIDLADLPFASEISFSGTLRPLERERLIRQWRGQAIQTEKAFAAVANAAGLDWSFEVRRGRPLFSMLEEAEREDVVVFHTSSRLTTLGDVARAVRAATSDINADVLLTGSTRRQIIGRADATLVVLDDMTSRGEACCHAAKTLAEKRGMICVSLPCRNADLVDLAEQVRQMHPALIVADGASPLFVKDKNVTTFSLAIGCPVLLFGSERRIKISEKHAQN
ncbi:MAG: hypothetical protein COA62_12215 [Rhodobiaceae bacterium]|nr:MAG: hypothetical protein COA62_12215 [Rhodobiaceae bacterium]